MNADNELAKTHLQRPFSTRQRGWVGVGLGLCAGLLAWQEYLQPSAMPYTGRWGWLKTLMQTHLGHHGIPVGLGLIGLLLLLWGAYEVAISRRSDPKQQD